MTLPALNPDAVLGAISAVFAGPLARKIGLVNTMVFTHAPSSAAVLLFPLPPASAFGLVVLLLLVRAGLNMMDQAPRTALIAAVVRPRERTAVMGVTSTLRTLASMAGPGITGLLAAGGRFWVAFVVAGACRLAYDFGLWAVFVNVRLHQHEREGGGGGGGGKPGSDDGDDDGDGDGGHRRGGRNGRRRQGDEEEVLELARLSPSSPSPRLSAAFSVASSSLADGGSSDDSDDEDDDDDSDDVVKLGSQTTAFPASRSAAAAAAGSGSGSLQVPRAMGQGDTVRSRSPHRARAPDA
ncbi:hypothetical protein SLS62_004487 [Diatrype stigma]|uniref:Major facilitator superfamily (MFS) profile domain-containing protein n=1 Tax=Diatrype stigma TaxID=117547 RepID=A0AAN9V352_9PEZI